MQTSSKPSTSTPTYAHDPAPAAESKAAATPAAAAEKPPPLADGLSPFLNVLITPKLTFSLPRKGHWRVAEDIPQQELAEAFLARFPVRFDPPSLEFKCATPALPLHTAERLVYRIGASGGGDDERVLLQILSSLDKAYAAKYEKQLEEARADMLSSSYSFQVVADEVRAAQGAAHKKWEREVRSLKEQMSTNQKRLFLLEREKEGLMKSQSASEELTTQLRRSVHGLSEENAGLREKHIDLEAQIASLREVVATHMVGAPAPVVGGPSGCAGGGALESADASAGVASVASGVGCTAQECAEVGCQTSSTSTTTTSSGGGGSGGGGDAEADAASRVAMERWQQQLSAMSDWLRTGAALLNANAPAPGAPMAMPAGLGPLGLSPSGLGPSGLGPLSAPLSQPLSAAAGAGKVLGGAEAVALDEPSSVC